ncbi:MAG TPA: hypothetical protein VIG74_06975, partial [Alphaproteobacteria bacterium]
MSIGMGLPAGTKPITSGTNSLGLFMGDQSAVNFAANTTMGLFGGKLVIDPAVPATQLAARSVIDAGAATDSIVFPSGTTAQQPASPVNGMMRYNTTNGKFEAYQAGAWQDILTSASSSALSSIIAATATNTIDSLNFAQTWNWSTLSTQNAMSMNANAITSGKMLNLGSTATAFTGTMANLTLSGSNAANTGTVLKSTVSGALSAAVPIMATNNGTGLSLRINDDGTDTDSTPVAVDASGKLVVGAATARALLDVNGDDLLVSGTYSGTASVPVTGAGTRMFFDAQTGSLRAGNVSGTQWDDASIGNYSVALGGDTIASGLNGTAMGYTTIAAGDYSNAFGNQVNISSTGDGSAAFGLTTTSPATDPIVSGAQSFALFMGNHSAVNFAAANTVGFFGGKLLIDSAVPATQLTARGVIDVGAATDAIVLPRGTDAQRPGTPVGGMFRYNTTATPKDVIEYYDAETAAWIQVPTAVAGGAVLSGITAATATNTIDSLNFAQAWNWSTLNTQTAMAMNANAITSGKMLDLASTATAFTGTMANLTLSGSNAANTGTVLKSTVSGVASAAVPLMATNLGTGLSFRVNDQTGDTDTTPFIVDASGKVAIGATSARGFLDVNGGDFIVSGTDTATASVPASGAGTRMFFDVQDSAFRAGAVNGTQWDNASTGQYSVAMGWNNTSSYSGTVALGGENTSSGNFTTAIGYGNTASGTGGTGATAIGWGNSALGDGSLALGALNQANNHTGYAIGTGNVSWGDSLAMGFYSQSSGSKSVSIGLGWPTTAPLTSGAESLGIYMGAQESVTFAATHTMGLFGGKMVIDPAIPATQLTARGVIDVGAATDAIV